jgi:hypothetical protein
MGEAWLMEVAGGSGGSGGVTIVADAYFLRWNCLIIF